MLRRCWLTDGQRIAGAAEHGIDAIGKGIDKVHAASSFKRCQQVRFAGVRVCEEQVFPDRFREQQMFLKDIGDLPSQ